MPFLLSSKGLGTRLNPVTTEIATWPTAKCYLWSLQGHLIDAEGLHTTADKLKAIVETPAPTNVPKLRSFLGLLNYDGKFFTQPVYSPLSFELSQCHDWKWKWTAGCAKAFQQAKDVLVSSQVLAHYNPTQPIMPTHMVWVQLFLMFNPMETKNPFPKHTNWM